MTPTRWTALPGLLGVSLVVAPAAAGVAYSLAAAFGLAGAGADGLTLQHVVRALTAEGTWRSVAWTIWTASVATLIATVLALITATALERTRGIRAVLLLPLTLPHAAGALAILLLLGQSGLLSRVAWHLGWIAAPADAPALVYDSAGIGLITAFVWKEWPFLTLAALAVRETRTDLMEEAARTLGASRWESWRRVTAPLMLRGMAPSAVAVLAFLLGQYEMALVLAPSDPLALSLLTYERAADLNLGHRGEAHVLALLSLGLAALLVVLHQRLVDAEPA